MEAKSSLGDLVWLEYRRNRGWPWPEDSWGLTSMFGEEGWCRSCGVPRHPQTGSIVLQRKSLTVRGAWVPYWQYDVICLEKEVAERAAELFELDLRPVAWPASSPGDAMQIVVPTHGASWFDPEQLRERAIVRHGVAGRACPDCEVWRWMPVGLDLLPPLRIVPPLGDDVAIAGSPEWFGDGWQAFRQILVRRELAELLATSSPRDFKVAPAT